jgi:hypothetical protein
MSQPITLESFLASPNLADGVPFRLSLDLFAPTERNCALALAAGLERDVAAFVRFFALLRSSHHEFSGFLSRNADWWNQQRRGEDQEVEEEDTPILSPPGAEAEVGMPLVPSILHLSGQRPMEFYEADNRCFGCLSMTKDALLKAGARILALAPNLEGTVVGAMVMDSPNAIGESHFALCSCSTPQHYHVPNPNLLSPVGILAGYLGNTPLVARLHEERQVLFARSSAMWGIVEGCHVDVLFYFIRQVFSQYVSNPSRTGRADSPSPDMGRGDPPTVSSAPLRSFRDEISFNCLKEAICSLPLVDRRRTIESVVLESGRPEMVRAIQAYRTERLSRPTQDRYTRRMASVGDRREGSDEDAEDDPAGV